MDRSWTLGNAPDCEIVLNRDTVSGHHCRLTRTADRFELEDLGSTNGTFVNGVRISGKIAITRMDTITLGLSAPLPWPEEEIRPADRVVTIGREADNDIVINLPIVSGHHARIVWERGWPFLEDLGSANGTAIGSPDRKIKRSAISASDTIFLGTHSIQASLVLSSPVPRPAPVTTVKIEPRVSPPEILATASLPFPEIDISIPESSSGDVISAPSSSAVVRPSWNPPWHLVGLLSMALAVSILIIAGVRLGKSDGKSLAIAGAIGWLGLSAVGFGMASVVFSKRNVDSPRAFAESLAVSGSMAVVMSLIAWLVVSRGVGLTLASVPAIGFLLVASAVGMALGLVIGVLSPRPVHARLAVPVLVAALWVFGGELRSTSSLPGPARAIAGLLPSRWIFEALLIMEFQPSGDLTESVAREEVVELYFPIETSRMGPTADLMALFAMMIGWSGLAVFLNSARRSARLVVSSASSGVHTATGAPAGGS